MNESNGKIVRIGIRYFLLLCLPFGPRGINFDTGINLSFTIIGSFECELKLSFLGLGIIFKREIVSGV